MIPSSFDYFRPQNLDEAVKFLSQHEDAKVLAGGHSLIPAMKLRLAQPGTVIDISRIGDLSYIREQGDKILIGAMTTHHDIESSALLKEKCPLLPEVAACIGDVQVRNKGTIGGSLVHADPAADWPAPILALDAELEIAGSNGRRAVSASEFFVDMMQTAVQPNEILSEIRIPKTAKSVAYVKSAQKASGFAIAGVAVVIFGNQTRIGVTGVAAKPFRASSVENICADVEPLNDIHASAEFRAHLAQVNARRAVELARSRE